MKNITDISKSEEILDSIKEIYTRKALSVCSKPGDEILIPQIIDYIKDEVYIIASSPINIEIKRKKLGDIKQFVKDKNLLKHKKLITELQKFIIAEFSIISEMLNKNFDYQETINNIEYIYIKRALSITKPKDEIPVKNTIKWLKSRAYILAKNPTKDQDQEEGVISDMTDFLENQELLNHQELINLFQNFMKITTLFFKKYLKTTNGKKFSTTEKLKTVLEETNPIEDAQAKIEQLNVIIKIERDKIDNAKKNIEDATKMLKWWSTTIISVAEEMIEEERENIKDSREIMENAGQKIKELNKTIWIEIQNQSLEQQYINKIEGLYTKDGKLLAKNAIRFMYNRIKDIIENPNMTIQAKEKALKNTPNLINAWLLENNKQAIDILKLLAVIKWEEELEKYKAELNIISSKDTPFKTTLKVIEELNKINKTFQNKEKCKSFIKKVRQVIPQLLQSISSNEDLSVFKVQYILPILEEIDIPIAFHEDFMRIIDIYNMEERQKIFKLAVDEVYRKSEIMKAKLYLEDAIIACGHNKMLISDCEKFVIYLQTNLPTEVAKVIIKEKEKERQKIDKNPLDISNTIQKMQALWNGRKIDPYDNALRNASLELEKEKPRKLFASHLSRQTDTLSPAEQIAQDYLDKFQNIPKKIKKKLTPYIISYYNHVRSRILKDEIMTSETFWAIKKRLNK